MLALASHNSYKPQALTLEFTSRVKKVEFFRRGTRKWSRLKSSDNKVAFPVEEYATELVRIER